MDNSGSAFPRQYEKLVGSALEEKERLLVCSEAGLTKREWFAGMALQGMCCGEIWPADSDNLEMARRAYIFADAMLAQSGEGK